MSLAQVRISCLPKSSPPSLASLSLPRDRHASVPPSVLDMTDAPLTGNHDLLATKLNGAAHPTDDVPDSPAIDSPATPVDNSTIVDIKIDVDIPPADSDLRSEPVQMNVDELDQVRDASTVPQLDTPQDPGELYRTLFTSDTP